jgi:uncharacterized protein YndB with AHSA1/START domain
MLKWLFGKKEDASGAPAGGAAEVIVTSRKVTAPREAAFDAFVGKFDTWWPKDRRIGAGPLAIEPRFGGRVAEGAETVGVVLSFHRPEHLVLAWQIGPDRQLEPGEGSASRIDVRFVPVDDTTTEVVVVHRDFARHGGNWQAYRAEMGGKTGWPQIVEAYAKAAGGTP